MKFQKMRGGNRGMVKSVQSAVWMIGMGYLFWTGNWWPGMFYLIGISILVEVVLKLVFASTLQNEKFDEGSFEAPQPDNEEMLRPDPVSSPNNTRMQRLDPEPIPPARTLSSEYRVDLLPDNCPNCGAPITKDDVEMVGIKTAKCGFCNTDFSLSE